MAFDAIVPFKLTPPEKFDGNNDNFEEFTFKLRAYLFLADPSYETTFQTMRKQRHTTFPYADFNDEDVKPMIPQKVLTMADEALSGLPPR